MIGLENRLNTNQTEAGQKQQAAVVISLPDAKSLRRALAQTGKGQFSWAYLGQSVQDIRRISETLDGRGTQISCAQEFQTAAEALRAPYLEFLFGLARRSDSFRWWVTSLSHRNPYTSKTLHYASNLKVTLDLVECWNGPGPLLVVVDYPVFRTLKRSTDGLRRAGVRFLGGGNNILRPVFDIVRMIAHRTFFLYRETYRVYKARRPRSRQMGPPINPDRETTMLVCWATGTNMAQGGEFHRSFFGDLADGLTDQGCQVAIVPMILQEAGFTNSLAQLHQSQHAVIVPEMFLSYLDVVRAAFLSVSGTPSPRDLPELDGLDMTEFVRKEIRTHWVSNASADAYLITALVRRLANSEHSPDRIIYIYENQAWERALCWQVRRSLPQTALIGYQPTPVPYSLSNFFLAPGEADEAPLPHRILTPGAHTAKQYSSGGYDAGRVKVCGALQNQEVVNPQMEVSAESKSTEKSVILVATSIGIEEASELIYVAANLFEEDEGVDILIKCHPMIPYERATSLLSGPLPGHVRLSNEPIVNLIPYCALMIYSGSTVCIQALALGIPAVHLRPQFDFDHDTLESMPDARLEAAGLEEMRAKVKWLLEHREQYIAQNRDRWAAIVAEMYASVTADTYKEFMDHSMLVTPSPVG